MLTPQLTPPTAKNVDLVQRSWRSAEPIADALATMFYERLFSLDPSVKPLFVNDFEAQKKKLMQAIGIAVNGLQKPQMLTPTLERLGAKHVGFMVEERYYKTVGDALLWTLGEALGDGFTPELSAAWTEFYVFVSSIMKRGAAGSIASNVTQSHTAKPVAKAVPTPEAARKPAPPEQKPEAASTPLIAQVSGGLSVALEKEAPLRVVLSAEPALLAILEQRPQSPAAPSLHMFSTLAGLVSGGVGLLLALLPALRTASAGSLLLVVLSLASVIGLSFGVGVSRAKKSETT